MTPRVSVVIPTLNPGEHAQRLSRALARQTLAPMELIVLDSESDDGSLGPFSEAGARVERVERSRFNHGRVRNRGVALSSGEIVVFMTQDAEPADERSLEALVAPLTSGAVDAAFARQLPRPGAGPLERFARTRNYPDTPRTVRRSDVPTLGVMAYFFSNACSAVRKESFLNVGGFSEETVCNEDMLFAARLLDADGAIAYVPAATVLHSHAYAPAQTFRRYFDIGAFFTQTDGKVSRRGLTSSGAAYAAELLTTLVRQRAFGWVVPAGAETLAKWFGSRLGRYHRFLPPGLKWRLSANPAFWRERARR